MGKKGWNRLGAEDAEAAASGGGVSAESVFAHGLEQGRDVKAVVMAANVNVEFAAFGRGPELVCEEEAAGLGGGAGDAVDFIVGQALGLEFGWFGGLRKDIGQGGGMEFASGFEEWFQRQKQPFIEELAVWLRGTRCDRVMRESGDGHVAGGHGVGEDERLASKAGQKFQQAVFAVMEAD
jgi:hypothetical protein